MNRETATRCTTPHGRCHVYSKIAVEHQSIAFAFDAQKLQMMQMGKRNELSLLQNNMLMIDIQLHFAGIHPYKFIQRFVFQKIRVFMERIGQDDPPFIFAFSNVHFMVS